MRLQAGSALFGTPQQTVDLVFGATTIVTAVIATLVGAWMVDRAGSSIRTSMAFCGWSTLVRCSQQQQFQH